MFYKLVGKRGAKREILASLLPGEYMDREGLVVRDGRAAKAEHLTGSNSVPVASVRAPLNLARQEEQCMPVQDSSVEVESSLLLQRSSPGGQR